MTKDNQRSTSSTRGYNECEETKINGSQREIIWPMVAYFTYLHIFGLYFLYAFFTSQVYLSTLLFQLFLGQIAQLGITAGVHRLWSHRAYKARAPLRILLAVLFAMCFAGSIFWWVRTHRVHHKYVDTDCDPHNARRGFIYSHFQWLIFKTHPDVAAKERAISMQDIRQDWVAELQRKYFYPLSLVVGFLLPTWIPYYFWGEAPLLAWYSAVFKMAYQYHIVSTVNSFAHMFGTRPYNRNIGARENPLVSLIMVGEGWHNYHHTFPWDYKAAEFGNNGYNPTTTFINLCAKLGLAYDLKFPSEELVRKQMLRAQNTPDKNVVEIWGWGDTDMDKKDKELANVIN